jgi:predicted transcriptional regulator
MSINVLSAEFLNIYNEIDEYMRNKLNKGYGIGHTDLIDYLSNKDCVIYVNRRKLKQFAKLRNAIVHDSKKNAYPIAEPHPIIVEEYKKILNHLKNPPNALFIAVPGDRIFTADLNDKAIDIINIMNEKCFTHVPVFDKGNFVGVFSENTMFTYLAKNKSIILDSNTTLNKFRDILGIDKHDTEQFQFISKNKSVYEVEELFRKFLSNRERLATVFITENGAQNEKLLGLITAWDVAGSAIDNE